MVIDPNSFSGFLRSLRTNKATAHCSRRAHKHNNEPRPAAEPDRRRRKFRVRRMLLPELKENFEPSLTVAEKQDLAKLISVKTARANKPKKDFTGKSAQSFLMNSAANAGRYHEQRTLIEGIPLRHAAKRDRDRESDLERIVDIIKERSLASAKLSSSLPSRASG